jgi:hypothetical protein
MQCSLMCVIPAGLPFAFADSRQVEAREFVVKWFLLPDRPQDLDSAIHLNLMSG